MVRLTYPEDEDEGKSESKKRKLNLDWATMVYKQYVDFGGSHHEWSRRARMRTRIEYSKPNGFASVSIEDRDQDVAG